MRTNQQSPDGELRLAIVGGGETDVELAAELYHVINLLKMYGMQNMSAERLKIDLIATVRSSLNRHYKARLMIKSM